MPKHQNIVVIGVSGAGKSSLVFDTIFAEGQRRFIEYMSPGARRSIKQIPKPDVDIVEGISPPLGIDQKRRALSSRSDILTHTDLHAYLSLLFAKVGEQYSPITGKRLYRLTRQQIVEKLLHDYLSGTRLQLIAPIKAGGIEILKELEKMGYIRFRLGDVEYESGDELPIDLDHRSLEVVVDRLVVQEGVRERLAGSVETVLDLSGGILKIQEGRDGQIHFLSESYYCPESSLVFDPLEPIDFNPLSLRGMCPHCEGLGEGCSHCHGERLKEESRFCRIQGKNLPELSRMTVDTFSKEVSSWKFEGEQAKVAQEVLPEIQSRIAFLQDVGVGYLALNRTATTLSEGEAQRIQLAAQLGAKLSGILYILDEPSRGLHPMDILRLKKVIRQLVDWGNSVITVEQERSLIRDGDYLVEMGPGAGEKGGKVVFEGTQEAFLCSDSPSLDWVKRKIDNKSLSSKKIKKPQIEIRGANCHNLQNVTLKLPLKSIIGLYGVSGSGKSSLAIDVLAEQLKSWISKGISCENIRGQEQVDRVIVVEQRATGVTRRSMPATFVQIMTPLRHLYSQTRLAKARGYDIGRFSLNKKGGRCEACQGLGYKHVDMQFMPDLIAPCEICLGKRYNFETLQVEFHGLSMADILNLTAEEVLDQFIDFPEIRRPLELMVELGLGYLVLGQNFTTLSLGEIQRLKLIAELAKPSHKKTLFILDEPCSGLHFSDIEKLGNLLKRLALDGHSLLVIEHRLDMLPYYDWIVELGPGGGPEGGQVVFEGSPSKLPKSSTATAKALSLI